MEKKMNIGKFHILSNMNTGKKITVVFILFLISSALLLAGMIKGISDAEKKYHSENVSTVLNSTEQYIDSSIENIVAIAKTIYTNNSLYSFLNKKYQNPAEYYDSLYQLENNNSLIITENQIIKKYTIYTDNPTVMNGKNIASLSTVKNEKWYQRFHSLEKPLIIYGDKDTRSFSLIRVLDYEPIDTGECCLKIDFNNSIIENYFDNLDFYGKLYVISGGTLLFSNTDEENAEDINITTDYKCYVRNYYTAELEYYAFEQNHTLFQIIKENIYYILPFAVVFLISAIVSLSVIINITSRTKKFNSVLRSENELSKIKSAFGGNDEIGKMFSNCVMIFDKLQFKQRELKKCSDSLEKSYDNSRRLLLHALHLDIKNTCFKKYPMENPDLDFSVPVPVKTEFEMLRKHLKNRNINYEIKLDSISDEISVLPFSIIMTADDLIHSDNDSISVTASANSECLNISFRTTAEISSGKILKLRTLFEDYPHQTDFDFRPGFIYNNYRRIKNYYNSNVCASISSDDGFCLTLTFII